MHQKLTKYGKFYKQNNQSPANSNDELEGNSNMIKTYHLRKRQGWWMNLNEC